VPCSSTCLEGAIFPAVIFLADQAETGGRSLSVPLFTVEVEIETQVVGGICILQGLVHADAAWRPNSLTGYAFITG